ncbi:ABC transporter permease [Amylibacter sp.]|jgi:peptide/nickel transport system permease protein|nr:ABC transporter permease [Paracoccaceae bacterium]MDB9857182.1 ABC transporter permease [Amylibacter sp.]
MGLFLLRRLGVMLLTALCLTFVVFFLTNLYPNLEKLAKTQGNFRMSDRDVSSWLTSRGYTRPMLVKYGEWLGVVPGYVIDGADGTTRARCATGGTPVADAPKFCGVLQGKWGFSTRAKEDAGVIMWRGLTLTGFLMMWALILTIPTALLIGVLAGMREGSKTDRTLSTFSIVTSATPEYVSGVVLIAIFASSAVNLKWLKGSATSAMNDASLENFLLPVLTIALFSIGYIARMTRASMTEVMTAQYIRTARLKGVSFKNIVMKHALRNALIAPFTVIILQIPYLLTGVVITETLFNYKGFGWLLVQSASNNDIDVLLGVSVISVVIVLLTQLISDIGYVYLNPRIRIS